MKAKSSVLCWNCREVGGREFAVEIKELLREYKPKILILLEPRISGAIADKVYRNNGRRRWIRSEAMGFSGGIWVCWDEDEVDLRLLRLTRSIVHMEVRMGQGSRWLLKAVYANPQPSLRRYLWERLEELEIFGPWMLVSDFNCVLQMTREARRKGLHPSFKTGREEVGSLIWGM